MTHELVIQLFVSDAAVLSSLEFALSVEGLAVIDGDALGADCFEASAVLIDRCSFTETLASLASLRAGGCRAPAILLATNPTVRQRRLASAAQAVLVEKPLLGDELMRALRDPLTLDKAA